MGKYKRLTKKDWHEAKFDCIDQNKKRAILKRLWEIENKIENGTLIELPCKVGTTIYQIYKDCSSCQHFKEIGWGCVCRCDFDSEESKKIFEFDGDNDCVYIIDEIEFTYDYIKYIKDFGKDLFLTKELAEQKIKELKEQENER